MQLLAIDPGPTNTAYCFLEGREIGHHAWVENRELLTKLRSGFADKAICIIESPQAQDRPLGKLLRDTIWWAARYAEVLDNRGIPWHEADERDVALWVSGNRTATNSGILHALKNHFGDSGPRACLNCVATGKIVGKNRLIKCKTCNGKGLVNVPGPLAGLNEHERSALAAALWYQLRIEPREGIA